MKSWSNCEPITQKCASRNRDIANAVDAMHFETERMHDHHETAGLFHRQILLDLTLRAAPTYTTSGLAGAPAIVTVRYKQNASRELHLIHNYCWENSCC